MIRKFFSGIALLALLYSPAAALASNTVLSGIFDGTEPRTDPLRGSCGGDRQLAYQDVGTFQVSTSGDYQVTDVFNLNGVDVTALIYAGSFNPNSPLTNLVTLNGVDEWDIVTLTGGTDYRLVVQQWCENTEGAWAVTFSGPGNVTSSAVRTVPAMTEGLFSNNDPTATTDCGTASQYHQTGPVQVAESGTYYYTDALLWTDVDVCLQVYTQPFDPNNPDANRVGSAMDDYGTVDLEAGADYYFVAQPLVQSAIGEYFYVLAPPAPFRISKALAGGWYDPTVVGQGVLVDVSEGINYMFLAWFTFDLTRPAADVPSGIGEAGQRWLTAQGLYDGAVGNLEIFNAQDMVFNSPTPPVNNPKDGTMTVEFTSCTEGRIDYSIDSAGQTGSIPIEPLFGPLIDPASQELCEALTNAPGMPGPLQ